MPAADIDHREPPGNRASRRGRQEARIWHVRDPPRRLAAHHETEGPMKVIEVLEPRFLPAGNRVLDERRRRGDVG